MHSPKFPHESIIEYVRLIVLGHVPLSVSSTEKELNNRLQLSPADPPPLTKSTYVVNGGGISPLHSKVASDGHMSTGGTASSIMTFCTHWPGLPHESIIEYVRVIVRGHVPLSVSTIVKEFSSIPQLSLIVPPPLIKSVYVVKAGPPPLHSNVPPGGQLITGGVTSLTVNSWIH